MGVGWRYVAAPWHCDGRARTAASLEVLREMLEKFDGCALKSTATRLVFADGNPKARIKKKEVVAAFGKPRAKK